MPGSSGALSRPHEAPCRRHAAAVVALVLVAVGADAQPSARPPAANPNQALIDRYCVTCHNQRLKTAKLALDTLDLTHPEKDALAWERAIRKLRGGMMPPPGAPRPAVADAQALAGYLETTLDKAGAANPNPGSVRIHRLNRAEYSNAMRDLFGLDVDVSTLLPNDDISEGFDNIASALKVSPSFLDQYIMAARAMAKQAVGTPARRRADANDAARSGRGRFASARRAGRRDGPVPGAVRRRLRDPHHGQSRPVHRRRPHGGHARPDASDRGQSHRRHGEHRPQPRRERRRALRVRTRCGRDRLCEHRDGESRHQCRRADAVPSRAPTVTIDGPFDPDGRSRRDAEPQEGLRLPPRRSPKEESACASRIMASLARKAFRRPVTDTDLAPLMQFFAEGRKAGTFETGIENALTAMLSSAKFLYRTEPPPANAQPGTIYRLSDLELASRLSFFLWSSIPDDELLTLAEQRKLSVPKTLEAQVRRMLADPRSKTLTTNFAFQWLRVRDTAEFDPDPYTYPAFDAPLRTAIRREMELFLDSVFREDRSVIDLLSANYTFLNERLARHYQRAERARRSVPPRDADRSEPLRPAGQGVGPDGDGVSQSHLTGAAWRLHSGEPAGHAARAAAAERGGVPGKQGRRAVQDDSPDHGGASGESDLQRLPRRDGPAGLRARELRHHRDVSRRGPLHAHEDRHQRQAGGWDGRERAGRSAGRRCWPIPSSSSRP